MALQRMSEVPFVLALAVLTMACPPLASAAVAEMRGAVVIANTTLSVPSDSHEPQRVTVDLQNLGPGRIEGVSVSCTFTGENGSVLETSTVSAVEIGGGARSRVAAIYYGWPRAAQAACRLP